MLRFYPRDIGRYRNGDFDFSSNTTLENKEIKNYKDFHNQHELIEYLKSVGVKLNDATYPLIFEETDHHVFGKCYAIKQWSIQGWFKEYLK